MKRMMAAAGVMAVGLSGLKGQNLGGLTEVETNKRWTLSGSLKGFYDDNNLNSAADEQESFGLEFSPAAALNLALDQTLLRSSYRMTLNYYEAREENNVDQDHQFWLFANHRFSQRREVELENTFVYSDSPALTIQEGNFDRAVRQDFSALRNSLSVSFVNLFKPTFGVTASYKNNLRDYMEDGQGSLSAMGDQVENLFRLDANWYPKQDTSLFVGYQFGVLDYTSKDVFGFRPVGTNLVALYPDVRNNRSHYFYVGGRRDFSRQFFINATVGAQYADYYNDSEQSWAPSADISVVYTYLPGSTVRGGLEILRTSTDVAVGGDGSVTRDALSTAWYGSLSHRITRRLVGTLAARYQSYTYNGGDFDSQTDDYFTAELGVEYELRRNFFANTTYQYFRLLSNRSGLSFSRNRVSVGVRAVF